MASVKNVFVVLGAIIVSISLPESTANSTATKNKAKFIPYDCMRHLTPDHFTTAAGDTKNGIIGNQFRWPRGVMPVVYHSSVTPEYKKIIEAGIKLIHDKSCLRVVEKTDEVVYMTIRTDLGTGCSNSGVGMRGTSNQTIHLNPDGCMIPSSIAHELLHGAGLWHEQSRPDRDTYIEILWDNIKPGYENQFDLCSADLARDGCSTFGVPYNVKSIMQYAAKNSFGKDPSKPVMRSRPGYPEIPQDDDEIVELTDDDVTKLHIMYNNCQG